METLLEKIENGPRTHARLSDYIKIKHGFAFKGEFFSARPTKDVLVTPGNFAIGGGFKSDKFKYYAGAVPEDYILKAGDLVVTMTDLSVDADTLGYSALIPNDTSVQFLHNQRVGLVQQIKEGIDLGFLYYLMRTREYQSYVVGGASGSTVKHTSPDRIASFEYDFPTLPIQRKIAEILSAYDEKIENNNKIIKNLESTAQALFDEWFVKFHFPGYRKCAQVESERGMIPERWEIKQISEIAKVILGGTPSRNKPEFWNGNIPWINSGEVNELRVVEATEYITEEGLANSNARMMKVGTVLIAITGATLGQVSRLEIESSANQSVVGVFANEKIFNEYLYLYIKSNVSELISGASGGAQQHINKQVVENFQIIIPKNEVMSEFYLQAKPLFENIKERLTENMKLKQIGIQLLDKLI